MRLREKIKNMLRVLAQKSKFAPSFFIQLLMLLITPLLFLIMIYIASFQTLLWCVGMMMYGFARDDLGLVQIIRQFIPDPKDAHFYQGIAFFAIMTFTRGFLGDYAFGLHFEKLEEYVYRLTLALSLIATLPLWMYSKGYKHVPTIVIFLGIVSNSLQYFEKTDEILHHLALPMHLPGFFIFAKNNLPNIRELSALAFTQSSSWCGPLFYTLFLIDKITGYDVFSLKKYIKLDANENSPKTEKENQEASPSPDNNKEGNHSELIDKKGVNQAENSSPPKGPSWIFLNTEPKEGSFLLNVDCFFFKTVQGEALGDSEKNQADVNKASGKNNLNPRHGTRI